MKTIRGSRKLTCALLLPLALLSSPWPANAAEPVDASLGECAFDLGGEMTVPAGQPISLRLLGFAEGTKGLIGNYLRKQTTTLTIGDEVVDISDTYPDPILVEVDGFRWWEARPVNYELPPMQPGESVTITQWSTWPTPLLIAYPPVGPTGFNGPFLARDHDGDGPFPCTITAE